MTKRVAFERITFNKRAIEALRSPTADRTYTYDRKTPGLACCVSASGRKAFYMCGRIDGKAERVRLGTFPAMTVENARKACQRLQGKVAEGRNVAEERRDNRKLRTLADLYAYYVEVRGPHLKSTKDIDFRWRKHLSRYAARSLLSIKRATIQDMHREIAAEHGKTSANRAIDYVKAFFNLAIRSEKWNRANPCAKFQRFDEQSRARFLDGPELKSWFAAVEAEPNETLRDFFLLLLFTAARKSNVQAMRWEDISFERKTWEIPPYHSKSKRAMTIPLTAPALEILERRRETADDSPWVFPSWGKSGHLVEPQAPWRRIVERAGLEGVRMHDLRRTAASWAVLSGSSLQVVAASLGHRSTASTEIYARLRDSTVRESSERAIDAMMEAANGDSTDEGKPAS